MLTEDENRHVRGQSHGECEARCAASNPAAHGPRPTYYPYGEPKTPGGAEGKVQFATYTRDSTASAQDYADQRYYSNVMGRFYSPDPSTNNLDLTDPGTWNAYWYANGDPINSNDPTGLGLWSWLKGLFTGGGSSTPSDGTTGGGAYAPLEDVGRGAGRGGGTSVHSQVYYCGVGQQPINGRCDVPLNDAAQSVFGLLNQYNPGAFINFALAVTIGEFAAGDMVLAASDASWLVGEANSILLGTTADGYATIGGIVGANTFTIPNAVWQSLTDAQRWAANQAFLDAAIRRGAAIILGSNSANAVSGTFFWREIGYLLSQGYAVSADGTQMIPAP